MIPPNAPPSMTDPGQQIMKKVIADLSKQTSAQALEAVQAGVPISQIIPQLMQMTGVQGSTGGGSGGPGGQPPPGGKKQDEAGMSEQNSAQPASLSADQQMAGLLQELLDANRNQQGMAGQSQQMQAQAQPAQAMGEYGQNGMQKKPFSGPLGVLKAILPILAAPDLFAQKYESNQLANEQARQKLMGQEPMQKGKREEIGMETFKELQKIYATAEAKGVDALPVDQATTFNLLLEGQKAVEEMDAILTDNSKLFGKDFKKFFGSQQFKQYDAALERAIQARTRVETKAAMAKGELEATKRRFSPNASDSAQTVRKKNKANYDFFSQSINVVDPKGIHRQRATGNSASQGQAPSGIKWKRVN